MNDKKLDYIDEVALSISLYLLDDFKKKNINKFCKILYVNKSCSKNQEMLLIQELAVVYLFLVTETVNEFMNDEISYAIIGTVHEIILKKLFPNENYDQLLETFALRFEEFRHIFIPNKGIETLIELFLVNIFKKKDTSIIIHSSITALISAYYLFLIKLIKGFKNIKSI